MISPADPPGPDDDAPWVDDYFGGLYDAIYRVRELLRPEWLETEVALIRRLMPSGAGPLLDLACGYGRHTVPLALAGYEAIGVDRHIPFLRTATAAAADAGAPARFVAGDMRALPFADASFALVALLFNSFGYLGAREAWKAGAFALPDDPNLAILREIARVLGPRGRCLIDLPNRAPLVELIAEQPDMMNITDDASIEERFAYRRRAGVMRNETLFRVGDEEQRTGYFIRLYTAEEMRKLLELAGLKPMLALGDHEGAPYDPDESDRMVLLAARP